MTLLRWICLGYFVILLLAAALNYMPGMKHEDGTIMGVFALQWWDDLLHVVSAAWALAGAVLSQRAARFFLVWFGALYLLDGLMGVVTGVGYLDLAIFLHGPQDLPLGFKIAASAPHIILGGFALFAGLFLGKRDAVAPS